MATNDEYLTEFTLKTHATGSYVSSLKSIPLLLVTIRDFSSIFALGSLHVIFLRLLFGYMNHSLNYGS